jgi:hypothetical protein
MDPNAKISRKTLKDTQSALDNHRIKILSFIYHRYISKTGVNFNDFISSYK